MRYAFIEAHRPRWYLKVLCRILKVSKQAYFCVPDGREPPRKSSGRALSMKITAVHDAHRQVYGSPRMHRHPFQPPGGGLGHGRPYGPNAGAALLGHGLAKSGAFPWPDLSQRPRQPVRREDYRQALASMGITASISLRGPRPRC